MFKRLPFNLLLILPLALTSAGLFGDILSSGALKKGVSGISEKRVEQKKWSTKKESNLLHKTFPITQWDKHYSSLGAKRSALSLKETKDKKLFKTETKTYPTKSYEMSEWNARLATLQKKARISTDDSVQEIADKKLYEMMLQDAEKYAELGAELSLRDLNRFQFRHNRSDGEVPVEQVGADK